MEKEGVDQEVEGGVINGERTSPPDTCKELGSETDFL
jgi:hypothetical protein